MLSEPSAAVVYLDGESQGLTPLDLDRLSPGDHRITLVKDGYIENSRIVSLEGNRPQTVDVTLTPSNDQMRYSMQIGGGGGGGSKLPLILGIAGGGAVVAVLLLRGSNEPPNPGTVSISPNRIGIAALTNFSFSSSASDATEILSRLAGILVTEAPERVQASPPSSIPAAVLQLL